MELSSSVYMQVNQVLAYAWDYSMFSRGLNTVICLEMGLIGEGA